MRQRPDLSAVPGLLSPAADEKEPFPGQNDGVIASIRPMPSQLQAGTREPQPFQGHLHLEQAVRSLVLSASAATIDRTLAETRSQQLGRRKSRAKPLIRKQIHVRTFADWAEPGPGYMEIDLVAHCGDIASGSFAYTLTLTDIASGWTEGVPLLVREASSVMEAIARLQHGPKPARHWRTREDPFEATWHRVVAWLNSEPDRTAKELLLRLQAEDPSAPSDTQLRTLQRRVKDWRRSEARRLVFGEGAPFAQVPNGCTSSEASG